MVQVCAVKLLLVDGFYYAYRSFHAIPPLTNAQGQPTGAIYGFLKSLRRMLKDLAPDRAAVVWDEGLPERRTALQPAYKSNRAEMPEALEAQLEPMRELIGLLGFVNVSLPGMEADDLMASYAAAALARGWETLMATADKDLFQVVSPRVRVYTTQRAGAGGNGYVLQGEEEVREKWGVAPSQLGDVLSLVGDASDNIPGVPGVGPKGAAALIQRFGSVRALFARVEEVESEKLREKLRAFEGQVMQNREMVRLDEDLPLPEGLDALRVEPRYPELLAAVERCAFKSLHAELAAEAPRGRELRQGELL
ncbi:MAG: polymerase [Verrucomicrobiota bacterium]